MADQGLSNPTKVFLATGLDFPDALSGGPAAIAVGGAVLLTADTNTPAVTANYLTAHPGDTRYALGSQAAAADPGATAVAGFTRYDTALAVAQQFFKTPTAAGVASGIVFADALAGGAHVGVAGGPMLLSDGFGLTAGVQSYLSAHKATITSGFVYGGTDRVSDGALNQMRQSLNS
ncbi:MAG: cell wall-binding repeat-containing protein [Acidimicrobiales bacterium]